MEVQMTTVVQSDIFVIPGIQAAYKAFKAYEALNGPDPLLPGDLSLFNSDQLFFIGFAQVSIND